jgi:hypothetical protein
MKGPRSATHELPSICKIWFLILITLIIIFATHAFAQSPPGGSAPEREQYTRTIRFAIHQFEHTYYYRFAELEYTEAFARLGYGFELHFFPSERALRESNSGRMDGEAGRIRFDAALVATYPNLIQVTEQLVSVPISAYTADTSIRLSSWKNLSNRNFGIGYPRGLKIAEKRLFAHVDAEYLFEITDSRQGLRMLRRGRIDVLIAVQATVDNVLTEAEFLDSGIALACILEVVPAFPYLHKKHHALAPQLAAVLKAMKKDGTYDRLVEEAKLALKPSVNKQ